MTVKVLCIWDVPEPLRNYLAEGLKDVGNIEIIYPDPVEEAEFLKYGPDVDVIIGWRPSRELLDISKNLKLFINPGAGIRHHIDNFREINKTLDVTLVNGHGNTYFTAQHSIGILLALMNKIISHHNWMVDGKWRTGDKDGRSVPLRDRHVGFLGYGAVNTKVHSMLSGFDLTFSALRRSDKVLIDPPTHLKLFDISELHGFLNAIDILFVAVPETSATIGMIGPEELDLLGPDGLIVNVARGSVIDEKALFEALKENRIAGAAIDVWYDYRPEPDEDGRKWPYTYPFHELDNIVLSPHRGASPMNDLRRWDEVITNLIKVAQGKSDFINVVDLENEY